MSCSGLGGRSKIAVQGGAVTRTFSDTSERYAFISEDIKPAHMWNDSQWGVGEIAPSINANRRKATVYSGTIILEGSRENIHTWLVRTLWSASSSSPLGVSADYTNHEFDILIDKENEVFRYNNCLVDSLTIFSDVDHLCYIAVGIIAQTETKDTAWPSPEPAVPVTASYYPYTHYESLLEINSVNIPIERVSLHIANKLVPVMRGSITPQKFRSQGREVKLSGVTILDADAFPEIDALLDAAEDAVFTYSNTDIGSVTINCQNFRNINHTTPNVRGLESIPVPFQLRANKDNISTAELSVTIAS